MRPRQFLRKPKAAKQTGKSQPFFGNGKTLSEPQHAFFPPVSTANHAVQFHTDEKAAAMAEQINAKAFTVGSQVFFNKNQYQPSTSEGKKLIAHEMVHATQHQHIDAVKRKPKETEEEKAEGRRASRAHVVFWNDLNKNYPSEGRKLAGSTYDRKTNYLKADFTEGDVQEKIGLVHHSGPSMLIGKNYVDEPDEITRIQYIKPEMEKIDGWRFDNYRIDDQDADDVVRAKLKGLTIKQKKTYEAKMIERARLTKLSTQSITEWLQQCRFENFELDDSDNGNKFLLGKLESLNAETLLLWKKKLEDYGKTSKLSTTAMQAVVTGLLSKASLQKISTPLQDTGEVKTDALGAVEKLQINVGSNVTINVLPDGIDNTIKTPGQTSVKDNLPKAWFYTVDTNGTILEFYRDKKHTTKLTMPSTIQFTVQTFYKQGVDKTDPSAYGRGTTDADKEAGNTSLQFHEGSHGTDYVNALKGFSFPASIAPGVVTESEFNDMMAFLKTLDEMSEQSTDEVGYTQSQYYADNPKKKPK